MMFKKIFSLIYISFFIVLFYQPNLSFGRENVNDWYIKNYQSQIKVNTDSSLDIIEKITADCGQCFNKHGIFRTLPTRFQVSTGEYINTPIRLISITDFNNKPHPFETQKDRLNHTITWKIGDPDVEVTGLNYYKIHYQVKNTIRFTNAKFDEFYWNLNGNFWLLEIDQFKAIITFPDQINSDKVKEINLYSGQFGQTNTDQAEYQWIDKDKLEVKSTTTLQPGDGITISLTVPKNIFTPYIPTFWEKYGSYFFFIIPWFIFGVVLSIWSKFGRDPQINPTIAPEFDIPDNLSPIELGVVNSDGILRKEFITAAIINLAVKGVIKIEEIEKGRIFKAKDYRLKLLSAKTTDLPEVEKRLINELFGSKDEIELDSLKNKFYRKISLLQSLVSDQLKNKKLLLPNSRSWQLGFFIASGIFAWLGFTSLGFNIILAMNLFFAALVIFVFSFLMTKRTLEGAKFNQRILGFKLFMETAEKYRQRFLEKENTFERLLPYAIMFGITKLWIEKMKKIYDEEYIAHYHPVWFIGGDAWSVSNIDSAITSLSSTMSSTLASSPSSSGSGGGGFSGGGGGGGGGGGW